MRKVTSTICKAFMAGKSASLNNTKTDGQHVWLFGNLIASKNPDGSVNLTLAGWNSVTTRDRLNGLIQAIGGQGRVCQRDHAAHVLIFKPEGCQSVAIDPRDVIKVSPDGTITL